jgi:type VI secretion system secreted protein Hcp
MPIYMQYSGITGDAQNLTFHQQWIEINSFQFGVGRGISSPTGGSADREASSPSVSEIVVTKKTDAASPSLFQHCLGGRRLRVSIVFTNGTTPGGFRHKLDLKDALIAQIQPYPRRSGRGEKLTITFSEYHFNGASNVPIPHTLVQGI